MTALQTFGEKIAEWAVIFVLAGAIGLLIGNSNAMETKAEVVELRKDKARLEIDVAALEKRIDVIEPRVERLTTLSELEHEKGKGQ
jgi:hypothetical protein